MFDSILDKGRKQQRRHGNLPYLAICLYLILEAVDTCARQIQISRKNAISLSTVVSESEA